MEEEEIDPAGPNNTSKRQRRPSVRLGDIGDQPAATLFREPNRRFKQLKTTGSRDQTKIRQLDKLSGGSEPQDLEDGDNNRVLDLDNVAIGSWKAKRVAKKPRTSWNLKVEEDGKSFEQESDELSKEQLGERDLNGGDEDDLDGVKNWLEGLGLRRYWPVFEIHEVDEEVLPLLTLEDLKDMGINAVGSRRKMFGAIQKLRKGFS